MDDYRDHRCNRGEPAAPLQHADLDLASERPRDTLRRQGGSPALFAGTVVGGSLLVALAVSLVRDTDARVVRAVTPLASWVRGDAVVLPIGLSITRSAAQLAKTAVSVETELRKRVRPRRAPAVHVATTPARDYATIGAVKDDSVKTTTQSPERPEHGGPVVDEPDDGYALPPPPALSEFDEDPTGAPAMLDVGDRPQAAVEDVAPVEDDVIILNGADDGADDDATTGAAPDLAEELVEPFSQAEFEALPAPETPA